jgi:hypothetical protein
MPVWSRNRRRVGFDSLVMSVAKLLIDMSQESGCHDKKPDKPRLSEIGGTADDSHLLWSAVALPPLGSEQGTLLVSVAHCLLVRTNAVWRIAEAGTEKSIEVRNIGKASDGKQTSL